MVWLIAGVRGWSQDDLLVQWLPEQMECGNLQIGKQAVALWIPMTQK